MTNPKDLAQNTPIRTEFLQELKANGLSDHTLWSYRNAVKTLERFEKDPKDLTKQDFMKWSVELQKEYSEGTQNKYKASVKRYIKWLHTGDFNGDEYPECVKWMKSRRNNKSLPKEILSHKEIKRIAGATKTQRDRAMVWTGYESGCRAGELLNMRIKDIDFDRYGAKILVDGKTGERLIRLVESIPDLRLWLSMHPKKNDREAFLWTSPNGGHITRRRLADILEDCSKRAGVKKHVYPHLLRHSRATHLTAQGVNEAQLREIFGWTKSSRMPSVYVHLSQRDTDATILNLYGVKVRPPENQLEKSIKKCPFCGFDNSPNAKFCSECNAPLDPITVEESLRSQDDLIRSVIQRLIDKAPEVVEEVLKEEDIRQDLERHKALATA